MSKRILAAGLIVLIGALVVWALPGQAEARGGAGASSVAGVSVGSGEGSGSSYGWGRGGLDSELHGSQNGTQGQGGAGQSATCEDCDGMGFAYGNGSADSESGLHGQRNADQGGTCDGCDGAVVEGSLTEGEVNALTAALEGEYKTKAVYEQVIADLGSLRPFSQIVKAEQRHIAALQRIFVRYGLDIPAADVELGDLTFATKAEACAAGVEAEIANAALYDEWLAQVDNEDVIRVFTALQSASLNQHLPAFEACAQ